MSFQDNGQPDIQTLLNRIKVLEDRQKPSVADLRKGIVQYALRQISDFDKYRTLELIDGLKNAAILCKDKKPTSTQPYTLSS